MIEFLEDFLVTQRLLISIILLSLITAVIIMKYWDRVKFWWTCTWYSFPVIGKISKLSFSWIGMIRLLGCRCLTFLLLGFPF